MATRQRDDSTGGVLPEEQEQLRRDADAAVRLEGEMIRRLARHGLRSVDEMVELHERLRRAADAIALPEIDFALARIGSLSDRLRLLRGRLDRLAGMARALAGPGRGSGEAPSAKASEDPARSSAAGHGRNGNGGAPAGRAR